MKNKRWLSLFSLILALVLLMSSCADSSRDRDDDDDDDEKKSSSSETMVKNNVYTQYSNLTSIKPFHNGLAAFVIYESTSTSHWGTGGVWTGDYYFGYIDTKGKVVIEPTYECGPHDILPSFEYQYIRYEDFDNNDYLINTKGEVIYQTGVDGVTRIGNISEGYFWVETESEDLSGSVYTVTYYSAKDLSAVVYFEDVRAFYEQRTMYGESTLTSTGDAVLIGGNDHSYYNSELIYFNISQYDNSYMPTNANNIVDIESIDDFYGARYYYHHVSGNNNDQGRLITVALVNSNGTWYYSIVDQNGQVLLSPQQNVTFPMVNGESDITRYDFCKDLCPAKDSESGNWGYIDSQGNWVIKPEYASAEPFTAEGLATVNEKIVIDTKGKVRLAPSGWKNEVVNVLSGEYKWDTSSNWISWYLTFSEDGTVKRTEYMSGAGSSWRTGTYQINGSTITFDGLGMGIGCPISDDGDYTFRKEGDKLYIGDSVWIYVNE